MLMLVRAQETNQSPGSKTPAWGPACPGSPLSVDRGLQPLQMPVPAPSPPFGVLEADACVQGVP